MKTDTIVSLIIATYNNPGYLKLSLESLLAQTILPKEVIIADDGSTDETARLIMHYKKKSPVPIIHIWQPDDGFQLGKIRNIATVAASGEYIIQIDGDIIMEKHFIQDHLFHRQSDTLLQGPRTLLSAGRTAEAIEKGQLTFPFLAPGIGHPENAIRSRILSTFLATRYRNTRPLYAARGCNMSYHKTDFMKVNGYNHDFIGWGHEDSELTLRMLNAGIRKHYIKFHCVAYHLHHKKRKDHQAERNLQLLNEQIARHIKWVDNGADQFLSTFQTYIR